MGRPGLDTQIVKTIMANLERYQLASNAALLLFMKAWGGGFPFYCQVFLVLMRWLNMNGAKCDNPKNFNFFALIISVSFAVQYTMGSAALSGGPHVRYMTLSWVNVALNYLSLA